MSFILASRVRETTTTTGTGSITLAGAVTGYQTFASGIGLNNQTYYTIADQSGNNWEVGSGTVTLGVLSRDVIYASSNSNALVNFTAGTKDVFCDYPAYSAVAQKDVGTSSNQIPLNQYLGTMAWQDAKSVNIQGGTAVLNGATITSASPVTLVMSNTNGTGYDTTITNTYSASENFSITTNSKKILSYSSSGTGGGGTTSISAGAGSVAVLSSLVPTLYLNGASGTNAVGFKAGTGSAGALEFYTNAAEKMRLHQSGGLSLGNTTDRGAGNLNLSGVVITGGYTVATLPTGVTGMIAYVTNALTPTYGATVVGGGAVTIPVFYNGTNWIVA